MDTRSLVLGCGSNVSLVCQLRRQEINHGGADGLEHGDLVVAAPPLHGSGGKLRERPGHVLPPQHATLDRAHQLPGLLHRGLEVDEHPATPQRLVVALPHRRRERAHQVQVRAGAQQLPAHDRLQRPRRAAYDVRRGDGLVHSAGLFDGEPRARLPEPGDERCGLGPGPVPDEDVGDGRERSEVGLREVGRERAGARERERGRRPRGGGEEGGGERGDGGGAEQRERGSLDGRERRPRGGAEEGDGGVDGGEARGVGGEGCDGLQRQVGKRGVRAPGGHQEERGGRRGRDREGDALRAVDAAGELRVGQPRAEVLDQGREREQRVECRRVDVDERVRRRRGHGCSALRCDTGLGMNFRRQSQACDTSQPSLPPR
jgi:hypothetical protein